ncbi:MAG: peptidylprolyl isomerase [Rubellimicrobium sp.]|nr:peptidylprolyl isomerase [Rubellimicrobium sp.]
MLRHILLATSAVAVLTLPAMAQDAAAGDEAPAEAAAPAIDVTRDTVVATVNGTDITMGEVIAATSQLPAEYRQLPPDLLFDGMVSQLVQQQLLADTVDGDSPRVALSLANERRALLAAEAISAFLPEAVTDGVVQAAYDAKYSAENAQVEYDADHILVATEDEAKAVIERLNAGEDFADLARELSTDTGSGANGGDLGWFVPGMMVEPFANAVEAMEPGTISDPVQSQFGWHVIKLNDTRRQAPPPLDAVRAQIEGDLQQAAIQARLDELQAGADITRTEADAIDPAAIFDLDLLDD